MATLEAALPFVLTNEGEFSNTAGDAGGETLDGIARKMHPEWPGWVILDALNLPIHDPRAADVIINEHPEIAPLVEEFYLKNYWAYDGIQYQNVATKLLDGAVNMEGDGMVGAAVLALQKAVSVQFPSILRMDGKWGLNTQLMVNRCNGPALLNDMARFYAAHYNSILAAKPQYAKFAQDWLGRAAKLPKDV